MVELKQDLSSVKRCTVKEVILAEINLISAKMESLREQTAHNTNRIPLWSDVVARMKNHHHHNKSNLDKYR